MERHSQQRRTIGARRVEVLCIRYGFLFVFVVLCSFTGLHFARTSLGLIGQSGATISAAAEMIQTVSAWVAYRFGEGQWINVDEEMPTDQQEQEIKTM